MDAKESNKSIGKPITIDALINDGGNWMVAYVYSNWGADHVLMLLPRLDPDLDSLETRINNDVLALPDGVHEEAYMINQWNKKHGETPFLVSGLSNTSIHLCITEMEQRCKAYNDDWDKFIRDAAEFDKWRKVAHYVSQTAGAEYEVWHTGWEPMVERAEAFCTVEENRLRRIRNER